VFEWVKCFPHRPSGGAFPAGFFFWQGVLLNDQKLVSLSNVHVPIKKLDLQQI
jgi:hypothetical protein